VAVMWYWFVVVPLGDSEESKAVVQGPPAGTGSLRLDMLLMPLAGIAPLVGLLLGALTVFWQPRRLALPLFGLLIYMVLLASALRILV
jgi:hypothetical protein